MGAHKLLYHVPLIWGNKEIAPKKMALISKGNTGNFSENSSENSLDYFLACPAHAGYGMLACPVNTGLPNRHEASNEYHYGFQGQEKDNEIKGEGNSINYKYRMHDPRVGRFFAVDPLTSKYPHYSPYSFSGNKVIHRIELEGKEDITFTNEAQILGDTYLELVSKNDILNDFYQCISDNNNCNTKLIIGTANNEKLNKSIYWGGSTYSDESIRNYAEFIFQVEERFKYNIDNGLNEKNGISEKHLKNYEKYKYILNQANLSVDEIRDAPEDIKFNVILINEKSVNKVKSVNVNNKIDVMNSLMHELDAHFEENIIGNKNDKEHSHHFNYFGYERKLMDPSSEIFKILKDGNSLPKSKYKNGSEAERNLKAIKDAIFKD